MAYRKRRSGRKRSRNFMAVKVQAILEYGTLASQLVTTIELSELVQDAYIISTDLIWTQSGMATAVGPVTVGLCHSGYTHTQIKEALDASPNSDSDLIAIEQSRRRVRSVGTFMTPSVSLQGDTLNDGKPIRTKCGWYVSEDSEVDIFAMNRGAAALTVDSNCSVTGTLYLAWK